MSEPPIAPDVDPGPVVTGWNDSPVTGDRIDVNENSFIAGDPAGARIEIRSTGFHAFNGTGTETAHIDGAEGTFVGGEFRTSDNLPGQVTLSDTAASGGPGISVAPVNAAGYTELPFVGPAGGGVRVSGGKNAAGESSFVSANPTAATLQAVNGSGAWTQISTDSLVASLVRYGADGSAGRVGVYPGFAIIEYEYEGTLRRIGVNNSGFFLSTKTGEGTTSRDLLSLFDRLDALEARVAALEN